MYAPHESTKGMVRACVALAGILGATGVCAGALGAHALGGVLPAHELESYQTAVRYQLLHALALLGLGVLAAMGPAFGKAWASGAMRLAAWGFGLGTVLFSGGIFAWLASGIKAFVHVVPVGGVLLAAGWSMLAIAGWGLRAPGQRQSPLARGSPAETE